MADAPGGGWYFIGRVPVSPPARAWGLSLVLLLVAGISWFAWHEYTKTDSYRAGEMLAQADQLRRDGKLGQAAQIYRDVVQGRTSEAPRAVQSMVNLLEGPDLTPRTDPQEAAGVLQMAWDLRDQVGGGGKVFERGRALAEAWQEDDPKASLKVLEPVEAGADKPEDYLPLKQKLLERLVKDQPAQVEWVSSLAVAYERTNQRDRCLALLEPLAGKLGTTEGARILGLLYFDKGKHNEAYGLLQPYAEVRLQALQNAQQQFQQTIKSTQATALERLKNKKAKDFDFRRFEEAPQRQQEEMVQDYIIRELQGSAELKRLREALQREAAVVPVALDLGRMQLERAQRMADPAQRKAELERAEKTFLAVRDLAGEDARYKVSLGQVYYWLGKPVEGKKLFDDLIQAENRTADVLEAVATVLRELGAHQEARTLLEEAYNQPGLEPARKKHVALKRSLTHKDLDDQITWLERADATVPHAKAALATARGDKAYQEGKDAEAARAYREAVQVWASQPEDATSLNNGGLAYLRLFHASGDREALEKGTQMMEKAMTFQPGDGILVGNVARGVLAAGLAEVVRDRIDLVRLRLMGDWSVLSYLYFDEPGRRTLARQLAENARLTAGRALLDRSLVLAPNNVYLYQLAEGLLSFLDDTEGLARLARRAQEAKLDHSASIQKQEDFWQGKNDAKLKKDGKAAVARASRLVEETRPGGGATFAHAADSLVRAQLSQEVLGEKVDLNAQEMPGEKVDLDALVQLAEEAHRTAPSVGTLDTLRAALLARASKTLAVQQPEYRELARKGTRSLGSENLVAVALWRQGPPRSAALANADVKRALELIIDESKRVPDQIGEWTWAMLQASYPDAAARVAEGIKVNERMRQERALEICLSPPGPAIVLRQCWNLEALGKGAEATELLRKAVRDKVPLPFEVQ